MAKQYKDRFSEAEEELSKKSAYVCTSCNTYYAKEKAKKRVASDAGQSVD
jgi:rubrerythrin